MTANADAGCSQWAATTYNDADELLAVDEMLPAATVLQPFEPLLAAPYSATTRALRLTLPETTVCTLTHVSVYLVGGQGLWNAANQWSVSIDALDDDLAPVTHLASGTVALLSDEAEPETIAALQTLIAPPLDTDAASDWGSANQWRLKANSGGGRDDDRGPQGPCARPPPGALEGRR
jgi:hypothetical protein